MRTLTRTAGNRTWLGIVAGALASGGLAAAEPAVPEKMETMVVVATRTERMVSDVPASVSVLDEDAIRLIQPITLDEMLKTMPGANVQASGFPGGWPRISLRGLSTGFGTKRILVLVDGRRVNDAYQGSADLMLLPADAIERIEVVRGPASALYGSNAMGGAINIVTKRGAETPVTFLRAAVGEHRTRHAQFAHGAQAGPIDWFLGGSHVETDGFIRNRDGSKQDWRADNALANIGLALNERADLRVGAGAYRGTGKDEDAARTIRNDWQSATYTHRWPATPDARFTGRVYRNGERYRYDWSYPGVGRYDQETLAAELQQSFRTGARLLWTAGGEFRREQVDIDETTGPIDEKTDTTGWFLQSELTASDTVKLTAGLRYDTNPDYENVWSPRLGALWHASDSAELFASVNFAHRAPSLSDRFVKVQYWGMAFEGNPDLDPETLTAYELGWRQRLLGGALQAEAVAFYNDMEDSFDFMRDLDGVFRNRNATRAVSHGVETGLRYAPTRALALAANYTWTDGEYKRFRADPSSEGNRLQYLARHIAALELEFVCPLGWSHNARWRYVGDREGDARNAPDQKMDAYTTTDWRTRAPLTKQTALTLSVDNIFDESYEDFPDRERPGRFVMAGIEMAL